MAVRTKAQLEAAYAALYADGQADDSITPARIRAFWLDVFESLLDDSTILQAALVGAVSTTMLEDSAVESTKIGNDAVIAAKIADDAITGPKINLRAAPRIVGALETLTAGNRLSYNYLDDVPDLVTNDDIRNVVAAFLAGGTDISLTRSGDQSTLTIAFTGTGSGSSRTDAQVQELARDAVGAALQANVSTGPRVGITPGDAANTITLALLGLAAVAGTGSYNDLSDRPTIPTVGTSLAALQIDSTTNELQAATRATPTTYADAGGKALPEAIRDVMGVALVQGNGITIAVSDSGDTITISATGSSTPAQPATFYYGISTDNAFVASEYTAVPSQTNPANGFAIPEPPANRFVAFAVPDTHADLSYISPNHATGDNQFSAYDRIAGTITLGGVAHKAWRSDTIFYPDAIGRTWYVR